MWASRCTALGALVAALLVTGCGAGSTRQSNTPATPAGSTPAASGSVDACNLVRQGDATALFGIAARQGALPPPNVPSCIWTATSKPGAPLMACACVSFELAIAVYPDYGSNWRSIIPQSQVHGQTDLRGVGDKATIGVVEGANLEIAFVKRGKTVMLTYGLSSFGASTHPKATDKQNQFVALARVAAARL